MFIFRATVSAVSCLVVPAFICIHLLFSYYSKLNDDDDNDDDDTEDECRCWCKREKMYVAVQRPDVIRQYSSKMGGVDLCDRMSE